MQPSRSPAPLVHLIRWVQSPLRCVGSLPVTLPEPTSRRSTALPKPPPRQTTTPPKPTAQAEKVLILPITYPGICGNNREAMPTTITKVDRMVSAIDVPDRLAEVPAGGGVDGVGNTAVMVRVVSVDVTKAGSVVVGVGVRDQPGRKREAWVDDMTVWDRLGASLCEGLYFMPTRFSNPNPLLAIGPTPCPAPGIVGVRSPSDISIRFHLVYLCLGGSFCYAIYALIPNLIL